ncbi:MAG: hypothetical protein ACI9VS_002082 [Candidatus Binatia bacterium]|jgi:hypothetical protein
MRRHEASNAQKKPLEVLVTGDQIFFTQFIAGYERNGGLE